MQNHSLVSLDFLSSISSTTLSLSSSIRSLWNNSLSFQGNSGLWEFTYFGLASFGSVYLTLTFRSRPYDMFLTSTIANSSLNMACRMTSPALILLHYSEPSRSNLNYGQLWIVSRWFFWFFWFFSVLSLLDLNHFQIRIKHTKFESETKQTK